MEIIEIIKSFLEAVQIILPEDVQLPDWMITILFFALVGGVFSAIIIKIIIPIWEIIKAQFEKIIKKLYIKRNMYPYFEKSRSRDVYEAIQYYIPTRYSKIGQDPANEDEPVPENFSKEQEREGYPVLLNRFLETEFDARYNNKFYFVLADCGMGKTTFLMNLFYYTLRKVQSHPCEYIDMGNNSNVIETIKRLKEKHGRKIAETILLLDALDENDDATRNYTKFMRELEETAMNFYCVVITSRTNFFEKGTDEQLPGLKRGERISRVYKAQKFYITPFTDADIRKYLKRRYPWNRKKQEKAWAMLEKNKNLAARPMLLKFMNELLDDNFTFQYDFQLYEKIFEKWIERECDKTGQAREELFQECLAIAKAIYYQWEITGITGKIGISLDELKELNIQTPGIENIKLKGHALINRTSAGMYKFAHKSYWEYLLAYSVWHDPEFAKEADIRNFDRADSFSLEILEAVFPLFRIIFMNPILLDLMPSLLPFLEAFYLGFFKGDIMSVLKKMKMDELFLTIPPKYIDQLCGDDVIKGDMITPTFYCVSLNVRNLIKKFSASLDSMNNTVTDLIKSYCLNYPGKRNDPIWSNLINCLFNLVGQDEKEKAIYNWLRAEYEKQLADINTFYDWIEERSVAREQINL